MLEDRNLTSHAYDAVLAGEIHGRIVRDYAPLLNAMSQRIQGLIWE